MLCDNQAMHESRVDLDLGWMHFPSRHRGSLTRASGGSTRYLSKGGWARRVEGSEPPGRVCVPGCCASPSEEVTEEITEDQPLAGLTTLLADDPIVAAATGGQARPVAVPEAARALFAA